MSRQLTAEEAKRSFIESMGDPLGRLFYALWQELAGLYAKWEEYLVLYGTKESRINLLNKAAPLFFRIIQDVLWEDIILHIARLTDPPKSSGKATLTIRRLPDLVKDGNTAQALRGLINIAIQSSEFCRDCRNRYIAHRDLNLALEKEIVPLKPASRKKIKEALNSIAEVLNAVSQHYTDSEMTFDIGEDPEGAVSLLYVIDDGLKAGEERKERISSGKYRKDDFSPRDL
ncbi:MAG: hypothetical protein WBC70_08960 [Candidatus Aminicenantales bacterium]